MSVVLVAGALKITTRVAETVTITKGDVAVLRLGDVPLVTTEVSVTTAVRL